MAKLQEQMPDMDSLFIEKVIPNEIIKRIENGPEARYLYSWRLDKNDRMPDGKRQSKSLREQEKELQATQFWHIALDGGNLTVLELVRRYTATKIGVRESTKAGYQTTINFLEKDPFGQRRIDTIKISDAKLW